MNTKNTLPSDSAYVRDVLANSYFLIKTITQKDLLVDEYVKNISPYNLRARTLVYLLVRKVLIRLHLLPSLQNFVPVSKLKKYLSDQL